MKLGLLAGLVFLLHAGSTAEQQEAAARVDATAVAQALWAPRSAAVTVPPGRSDQAVNGRLIDRDGTGTLTYSVRERCDSAAASVVEHFRVSGWRQRSSQILMPRLRTSFSSGCERVPNGVLSPEAPAGANQSAMALGWHGEWEDHSGNTVTYDVSSGGDDSRVRATFLPADVAVTRGLRTRRSPR